MPLTDLQTRKAKPKAKPYKLSDSGGLFLLIHPNGSKYWRQKYRFAGKEKTLAHGVFPEVPLKEARTKRDDARKLLINGVDPQALKKKRKETDLEADSFEAIAGEWFAKFSPKWAESHSSKILGRLEKDVYPYLGSRPIQEIRASELLQVLRRVESRGAIETAHRVRQHCGQVFRYAVATGRAERDLCQDLKGALPPPISVHHGSITDPKKIAGLLRALESYEGHHVTCCALQLAPLVFVRPGELRKAEWDEIDLDAAEWRIPAVKMKMKQPHIVPLSTQAVAVLKEIGPLTGNGQYVFPSVRTRKRPMSENTVTGALRRLGYQPGEMTGHGFRSMASTLLNEQGWNRDAIERQLAHAEGDEVRAAYNYAQYLPERRKMMQAWADYLDGLKNTVPA
ncbi:MAG: integrase arm-type DNA-binding domain-containing protein [Pseudomonadota bacterium]|nr:integrase arm-type DNA-binding domain-containing protein [Pseudomonadota bacterium]